MSAIDVLGHSVSTLLLFSGLLLIMAEAIIPGAHFIIVGAALFTTGLIAVLTPIGGNPLLILLTFVIVSITIYLLYSRVDLYGSDGEHTETTDSEDLEGIHGVVTETVTSKSGKVDLEKSGFTSEYQARTQSGTISTGTEVIVTDGRGGSVIEVEEVHSTNE